MIVTKKTSCMVKPAESTWSGRLPLSELDQTGVTTHVPTIYFYSNPNENWDIIVKTLTLSLSKTLVHFYPLAGRLSPIGGGRLELNCNAAGVNLTEACANVKIVDLNDLLLSPFFRDLTPNVDYQNAIDEIPLLLVQITRFVCGGFSLGLNISHVAVDGKSALHFVDEWARVSRGEPLGSPPFMDRTVLRAGDPPRGIVQEQVPARFRPPPTILGQSNGENEHKEETTETVLKLSETLIEKLRKKANETRESDIDRGFTRYETITAHIWRTACKVRNHEPKQPTALNITVDIRRRIHPPLPENYFGNGIVDVIATGFSGEIITNPLGYTSSKIREAIESVDDNYVNSVIDFMKNQEDLSQFLDGEEMRSDELPFYGNPSLGVLSWLSLPIYGADFGWGKEIYMGPGTNDTDGASLILPCQDKDGSLMVVLCLQVRHMEHFKNLFYLDIDMN